MAGRLLVVWLLAFSASAADITGIWTGQVTENNREPSDFSFRFSQGPRALSGKMYTDNESVPLKELQLEGTHISFVVTSELNGQVNTYTFKGDVHENEMDLERTRETNKKEDKPLPKLTLRLKRLV